MRLGACETRNERFHATDDFYTCSHVLLARLKAGLLEVKHSVNGKENSMPLSYQSHTRLVLKAYEAHPGIQLTPAYKNKLGTSG